MKSMSVNCSSCSCSCISSNVVTGYNVQRRCCIHTSTAIRLATIMFVVLTISIICIGNHVNSFQPTLVQIQRHRQQQQQQSTSSSKTTTGSSSSLDMSIPTPLDTLTSGLASICRTPRGVTVSTSRRSPSLSSSSSSSSSKEIKQILLYDIENNVNCRRVREVITELDLNIDVVIPATKNSRCFVNLNDPYYIPPGTTIPSMIIMESTNDDNANNDETSSYTIEGADDIIAVLESKFGAIQEESDADIDDSDVIDNSEILPIVKNIGNFFASLLRIGRGTKVCGAAMFRNTTTTTDSNTGDTNNMDVVDPIPRPQVPLILYNYEGNQFCRLVREVLTELDIRYTIKSVGKLSERRYELSNITIDGSTKCPYLIDPNTNIQMFESKDIIQYLYTTYALYTPPNEILHWVSDYILIPFVKPVYSIIAPLQAGSSSSIVNVSDDDNNNSAYQQEVEATWNEIQTIVNASPIVIYTYTLSPFAWEAKAILDNCNIEYKEISLGYEWIPGLIVDGGSIIRATLLEKTGQSSLPHIFINGQSIGGLFSGTPGLLQYIEQGNLSSITSKKETPRATMTVTATK